LVNGAKTVHGLGTGSEGKQWYSTQEVLKLNHWKIAVCGQVDESQPQPDRKLVTSKTRHNRRGALAFFPILSGGMLFTVQVKISPEK
jgi:hypothetical protein